jgi:protein TonB
MALSNRSFARQQRDPTKHMIGIVFVVLLHVLIIYALMTGLARTVVEVIKKPLSANIIDEIKPPPPPPPPPKKIQVPEPPPAYVPPPDIPVAVAPTTGPTISAVTAAPPPPQVAAPPPVVAAPPPPPPPKPAVRRNLVRIGGDPPEFPRAARRNNIEKGQVLARLMIDEKGNVTEVIIVSANPPRHFDKAVIDALSEWKFKPEGEKYVGEIEIAFTLKD